LIQIKQVQEKNLPEIVRLNLYQYVRDVFGEEETQSFSNLPLNRHKKMLVEFLEQMSGQLHFSYGEEEILEDLDEMYIAIPVPD